MHGVAGVDDVRDFVGVAVNQGHLAGVPQGHAEQVFQVQVVHLLGGALLGGHDDFPGGLHLFEAVFRGLGRFVHDVLGHQLDFFLGEVTGGQPVRHAGRRAVADKGLEVVDPPFLGDVRRQRLAGRALAQDTMAAGAAFKVDLLGLLEFGVGQVGCARCANHLGRSRVNRAGCALIGRRGRVIRMLGGVIGCHGAKRRYGNRKCQWLDKRVGYSHQVLSLD